MEPINKEHDADYWRNEYERLRSCLVHILKTTRDEDMPYDDIVNDVGRLPQPIRRVILGIPERGAWRPSRALVAASRHSFDKS